MNNNRKRSIDSSEDAEISAIISDAEKLKQKFINIKEPIEGEFSHALDELDIGETLEYQLRINAQNARERLSNPQWVRTQQQQMDSAHELMTLIPIVAR